MEETVILETLRKWNLWDQNIVTGIKRNHYVKKILQYMDRKEIIVLKGIRRCGKSTILRQLMEQLVLQGIPKSQLLYVNLEDYLLGSQSDVSGLDKILAVYQQHIKKKGKIYLFLDEIQAIQGWERWVRTLYDRNEEIKFILTGSNASLLSKDLATLLTGRNVTFIIYPLSFEEYKSFKGGNIDEYLKWGGFPEVVLEKDTDRKNTLIKQYFEDIINRDIISRHGIRNAKQFTDLALGMIATSGTKVSLNKLAKIYGLSRDTIATYINFMVDAFLLTEVNFFSHSARIKHDVTKLPKFYANDLGFLQLHPKENKGQQYENAAFIKLLQLGLSPQYWLSINSEVDFIVNTIAINITSTDKIPERERKGLDEFQKIQSNFSTMLVAKSDAKEGILSLQSFLLLEKIAGK